MPKGKKKVRSPLKLLGGKGTLRNRIIRYFPEHRVYVEPFGGGGSVLLAKEPCEVEVYNDRDPHPVEVFRAIQDEKALKRLTELLWMTPYSRLEREHARLCWDEEADELLRAAMYFVNSRQSFGGNIDRTSWGLVTTSTARGKAQPVNAYIEAIKMLPHIRDRIKDVHIYNDDYWEVMKKYDSKGTLFYLDPPYPQDTRRDGFYECEMDDRDHQKLVRRLLKRKGFVILSGYWNEIYDELLEKHDWAVVEFRRACSSVARTRYTGLQGTGTVRAAQERIDCLWLCPKTQSALELDLVTE